MKLRRAFLFLMERCPDGTFQHTLTHTNAAPPTPQAKGAWRTEVQKGPPPPLQGPGGTAGRWRQTTTAPKDRNGTPQMCARYFRSRSFERGGFFAPSCEALEEIGRRGSNARGGPRVNNNNGDGGE
uniref:Uncharacterized protein n=1 Tax=Ixodes ricinus TaxID=34613 RepID=A0A6B0UPD7_IXORI